MVGLIISKWEESVSAISDLPISYIMLYLYIFCFRKPLLHSHLHSIHSHLHSIISYVHYAQSDSSLAFSTISLSLSLYDEYNNWRFVAIGCCRETICSHWLSIHSSMDCQIPKVVLLCVALWDASRHLHWPSCLRESGRGRGRGRWHQTQMLFHCQSNQWCLDLCFHYQFKHAGVPKTDHFWNVGPKRARAASKQVAVILRCQILDVKQISRSALQRSDAGH